MFGGNTGNNSKDCIVVVGNESSGKSELISNLSGQRAYSANYRGSTVSCELFEAEDYVFVDTPGVLRSSDSATTKLALAELSSRDLVLLVVRATQLDEDLKSLLPLVKNKRGIIVVTHKDKVRDQSRLADAVANLTANSNLRFIAVDARKLSAADKEKILCSLQNPLSFEDVKIDFQVGWVVEPRSGILEKRLLGPVLAFMLLFVPGVFAVQIANKSAEHLEPYIKNLFEFAVAYFSSYSSMIKELMIGDYGLATMGPLLFVWAVPTVVVYAFFLGLYKASGLAERITVALDEIMRPFGLDARGLIRVVMGFGCNVPAVVSTRSCSACKVESTQSAISFGSACSYQFGATLAVFAAVSKPDLVLPFLFYLCLTFLIYTRIRAILSPKSTCDSVISFRRNFLVLPRVGDIWREARLTILHFFGKVIPIFLIITAIASILNWIDILTKIGVVLGPLMSLFNLPYDSALAVLLACIRKDGIVLLAEQNSSQLMNSVQVLTAVYLAGVLLPCLVTAYTVAKERGYRFVVSTMFWQSSAVVVFSVILAWGFAPFLVAILAALLVYDGKRVSTLFKGSKCDSHTCGCLSCGAISTYISRGQSAFAKQIVHNECICDACESNLSAIANQEVGYSTREDHTCGCDACIIDQREQALALAA